MKNLQSGVWNKKQLRSMGLKASNSAYFVKNVTGSTWVVRKTKFGYETFPASLLEIAY